MSAQIMTNYSDSALRHWSDAERLRDARRVENADQLYGLAAECAIKSALDGRPRFSLNGQLTSRYMKHVNVLWEKGLLQSGLQSFPRLAAVLRTTNPFADWDVNQRYGANGSIREVAMESHRVYAKRLLGAAGLTGERRP